MRNNRLWLVYLTGFFLAVHFASVSYINSSLISQYVSSSVLSLLYVCASTITIGLLVASPLLLRKFGSVFVFLSFILIEIIATISLGYASIPILVIAFFLIHVSAGPVLSLCLDINLEGEIDSEKTTGIKRSLLLTISNIAWVVSPLALVFLVNQNVFSKVYLLSGSVLIILFFIVKLFFKNTKTATVTESNIFKNIKLLKKHKDRARIIGSQFMLNTYYAWMVIYLPILLIQEIVIRWSEIGNLFVFMFLPFVIFQLPAGFLADKKTGGKELLVCGFIIMFISTLFLSTIKTPVFWVWAITLFATRVGAGMTEVANESYFFKHVKEEDTGLISIFRIVRPLAYITAPLLVLPIINIFSSYRISFMFLSAVVLLGFLFIPKVDTR